MNWETDWIYEDTAAEIEELLRKEGIACTAYFKGHLCRITILNITAEKMRELSLFSVDLWDD